MTRRKKSLADMMSEGESFAIEPGKKDTTTVPAEEPKTTSIDDFYLPHKVAAFHQAYNPVDEETLQSETFTEARLREFFKAYVLPGVGDPLQLYLDALAAQGFHMSVTMAGEPAIIVEQRY